MLYCLTTRPGSYNGNAHNLLSDREDIEDSNLLGHDAVSLGEQSFWNIGNHSPNDTVSHYSIHKSQTLLWEPQSCKEKILFACILLHSSICDCTMLWKWSVVCTFLSKTAKNTNTFLPTCCKIFIFIALKMCVYNTVAWKMYNIKRVKNI